VGVFGSRKGFEKIPQKALGGDICMSLVELRRRRGRNKIILEGPHQGSSNILETSGRTLRGEV